MTDGVLAYIDGDDRKEAVRKIRKGAAQNAPDQVREFAAALRALKSIPGADQYMGPVLEVADILASDEGDAKAGQQKARARPKPDVEPDTEQAQSAKEPGPGRDS